MQFLDEEESTIATHWDRDEDVTLRNCVDDATSETGDDDLTALPVPSRADIAKRMEARSKGMISEANLSKSLPVS